MVFWVAAVVVAVVVVLVEWIADIAVRVRAP